MPVKKTNPKPVQSKTKAAVVKKMNQQRKRDICPKCDGRGEIRIYNPGGDWVECSKCKGTGKRLRIA
jgi:DnaJ-class molecular chaperone